MSEAQCDYVSGLIEEIALEGLDGITIDALWLRLRERPNFPIIPSTDGVKRFLWKAVVRLKDVEFYQLPTPRPLLHIVRRLEQVDEYGNYVEPVEGPLNVYPHKVVENETDRGSCADYDTRVRITEEVRVTTLADATRRWGSKLVVVASQACRHAALYSSEHNMLIELTTLQYCVLERIGRSRYEGEITQGKNGLQCITDDPKTMFYYRNNLRKHKLITKQIFYVKQGKQNYTGLLLHLTKFTKDMKSKYRTVGEKIIEYVKQQPGQFALCSSILSCFDLKVDFKKLILKYSKYLKSEMVPYRQIFPEAKNNEWKTKSGSEKALRIIRLVQQYPEEQEEEEEEDGDGLLDLRNRRQDRSLVRQCYALIEQSGPRGISQSEISKTLGFQSLLSRGLVKVLVRKNLCGVASDDVGRQRISYYYSKKFDSSSNTFKHELLQEKNRLIQIITTNDSEQSGSLLEEAAPIKSENSLENEMATNEFETKSVFSSLQPYSFKNAVGELQDAETIATEIIAPKVTFTDRTMSNLMEETFLCEKGSNALTVRTLRRANLILQAVNNHRVIHDPQKILRMINEEEESEGFKHVVDRKTVARLIDKLEANGHVRTITVNLRGHGREKKLTFICHPSITEDNSEIQSAIEQAKMKLPIIAREPKRSEHKTLFEYNRAISHRYGLKPKFVRMQILHMHMFYLVHGYDGQPLRTDSLKEFLKENNIDENLAGEMSTVYSKTLDWKMFIPPLPAHAEYPNGWCMVSDLLLRLPLSLFVAVVNVPYIIPNLFDYLNHPIKKFYLVRNLPVEIANHLTFNRKYIFTISEFINKLGFIGLVQMGPQKLKEKDQVFVYLNKNAVLLDTTTSASGYNHVSKDILYKRLCYHFKALEDVEHYWHDLWNFAMNTNLGCRNVMAGKPVVVESVSTKKQMMEAVSPVTCEEAIARDVGYLPGDLLGAAGLDSDLFVHLKRNWYWTGDTNLEGAQGSITNILESSSKQAPKKPAKKVWISKNVSVRRDSVKELSRKKEPPKTYLSEPIKTKAKHRKVTRIFKPKKTRFERKPYYDQIDKEALRRMVKLRVDWSPTEDNLLLICKVASIYLSANTRRCVAKNFCVVREILHSTYPDLSKNKTSRACQRRMHYMMKNPSTSHSVYMCLEEIKQDPEINDEFSMAIEKFDALLKSQGQGPKGFQKGYDKIFTNLVTKLLTKLKTITHNDNVTLDNVTIPNSVEEFRKWYKVVVPKHLSQSNAFNEVQNTVDIMCSVVNSLIHSSLCCTADKTSYSYQLFYVYQQYPDKLLRSVMAKCRSLQVVSCRKRCNKWKTVNNGCLPLSSSPYQLSITYVNILQTKFQYNIYSEAYASFLNILNQMDKMTQSPKFVSFNVGNGGECANIVELFSTGILKITAEFPEHLMVLDPRMSKDGESYSFLLKRFKEMMTIIKANNSKKDSDEENEDDFNINPSTTLDEGFEELNLTSKTASNTSTRLALYMMRDEPVEYLDKNYQHAHDFFVLKPCKISISFDEASIHNVMFLENKDLVINEIKKLSAFPEEHSDVNVIDKLKSDYPMELITSLIGFLESKKELGATPPEISNIFGRTDTVASLLSNLVDSQLILKSGSVGVRYIHYKFTKPWLIRSYFIPRSRREPIGNTNTNYSFAYSTENGGEPSKSTQVEEPPMKKAKTGEMGGESRADPEAKDPSVYVLNSRKRKSGALQKETKFGDLDTSTFSPIQVLMRPWIRVDGTLNRRVLDRLLGAVLGHCLSTPGISMKRLQSRFSPALQPVHVQELSETLSKIGCLQLKTVTNHGTPSLFSKRSSLILSPATGLEDTNNILAEPTLQAVSRLGYFIGDKSYVKDYLEALTDAKMLTFS